MKLNKLIILLLVLVSITQANPYRRYHAYPVVRPYYYNRYLPLRYNAYVRPYLSYRVYVPVTSSAETTTTSTAQVIITAEIVANDIVGLHGLMLSGMITEKDYERSKKTLLNRIGESVDPDEEGPTTAEIIGQIETLYQMRSGQLLTEKEYQKQKQKLLSML